VLKLRYSSKFKKDFKTVEKHGYDISLFEEVLVMLVNEQPLPKKYRDHLLSGNFKGHRECHITPDCLLVYKIEKKILTLSLTRTATHSDIF